MSIHAPLVPNDDADLHFVLCDFGRLGLAYMETDPSEADREAVVRGMVQGQYEHPRQVIAFNVAEGCRAAVRRATQIKNSTDAQLLDSGALLSALGGLRRRSRSRLQHQPAKAPVY